MHVLGINYSNDAAACIVRDGHVIAACQEERFRRIKHYSGFPEQAIRWCLGEAGITMEEVDHVGFFWNPGIHAEAFHGASASRRHHQEFLFSVPNYLINRFFDGRSVQHVRQQFTISSSGNTAKTLDLHYCTHHLTHAAGTFYRSNFDEAAILLVDGYGERASTTIATGRGTTIETLQTIDFPHSVGSLYAAFTQFLGFQANNGEGKVMGLASYGQDSEYVQKIRGLVELTADGFELDLSYFSYFLERTRRYQPKLQELMGPERRASDPMEQRHYDIAYALQKTTEDILLHLAHMTKARTGLSKLCMAGGVVLNCVANARIQREAGFDEVYFMPCSSDAGTSMGAALMVAHDQGAERVEHPMTDYLGPQFTNDEIAACLDRGGVSATRLADLDATANAAADAIADGQIIGWFQGRAEFGPRSLGNRSILCDPARADMKEVLNARVKFREPFRPFAPSILEEAAGTYFADGGKASPFMLLVYDTLPEHVASLPAVTHVDGGARVQTVSREQNERYYTLIKAVGERTGVPCVVNTSFNIRGEPIVNSPEDALRCFFTNDMDKLFLGDFLIAKG
ncbi:MAG: carbamoyltransferase [Myxococcota bacterium]|jgi:carbamoyltransferase